ncbi:MAG TPA: FkbM family methyltransferase [Miltoncostaea sp.]|nr:FkbM family methyltransferase [Miltoncostaea sp.]
MPEDYPETVRLPPIERAAALVRTARLTEQPATFMAREVAARRPGRDAGAPPAARYRLRGYGCELGVRHGTLDVALLYDIMVRRGYAPPAEVLEAERPGDGVRVVDLGANIGLFAAFISTVVPVTRLVAYEPDRTNAAMLRDNLAGCPALGEWRLVEACAGNAAGEVTFLEGQFQESRVVPGEAPGGRVVPVLDAFADMADADWVKIDIEGSEWDIIGDPRFRELPARVVVLEYHRWMCPGGDPRRMAVDALTGAGYTVWGKAEHVPGYGELWGMRR